MASGSGFRQPRRGMIDPLAAYGLFGGGHPEQRGARPKRRRREIREIEGRQRAPPTAATGGAVKLTTLLPAPMSLVIMPPGAAIC